MSMLVRLGKNIAHRLGYSILSARMESEPGIPIDFSVEDVEDIKAVRPFTMTGPERIQALTTATRYVAGSGVPGSIVECGVWKGGSMMAVARVLARSGDTSRHLYLFDTFDGMTDPTEADRSIHGESAAQKMAESQDRGRSPLDEVRRNMATTGYPDHRIHYVAGRVEDTVPREAPAQIALLRLDTDWYESTRHEMEHLFPRLARGGVLIVDDYGHWQGARRAIDEYLESQGIRLLLNRIDYTGRISVKL